MTRHVAAAMLMVLVSGAQPALAQAKAGWKRQPTPYRGLFQTEDLKETAKKQQEAPVPQPPRVLCGMSVIPMDPNIDPKMIVPRPPDDTRYTMRVIPPPICK
jgi:hypothetical protein